MSLVNRGTTWHQVCDSKGSHNAATITYDPVKGTHVVWTPTVRPPGESWDNVYIWQSNPDVPYYRFAYFINLTLADTRSLDNLNCFEFEIQVVRAGMKYNMAWQVRKGAQLSLWTFDFNAKQWVDTGLRRPLSDFTVGQPTQWVATFEMQLSTQPSGAHHTGLSVGEQFYAQNILRSAGETNERDYLNFAFQFDSLNRTETITAQVDAYVVCL